MQTREVLFHRKANTEAEPIHKAHLPAIANILTKVV